MVGGRSAAAVSTLPQNERQVNTTPAPRSLPPTVQAFGVVEADCCTNGLDIGQYLYIHISGYMPMTLVLYTVGSDANRRMTTAAIDYVRRPSQYCPSLPISFELAMEPWQRLGKQLGS